MTCEYRDLCVDYMQAESHIAMLKTSLLLVVSIPQDVVTIY